MKLSKRVMDIKGSATLAITSEVGRLQALGREIFSFTAGQLDFSTPDYIKKAAFTAINENFTRYTPVAGIPALRKEIALWTNERYGVDYNANEVLTSCGAKQSLFNSLQAVLEEGDECIIFSPYWVSYPEMIISTGAKTVIIETLAENGFIPNIADVEKAITDKTRAIIINSPQNPTGAVYPEEFFDELAKLLKDKDIVIISDEIYSEIVFDGAEHHSIAKWPGMQEKTVIINGVSKTFAMTGWRIGWALGPQNIIDAAKRLQSHSTSNPCSISQKAALEALNREKANEFTDMIRKSIKRRKELALSILGKCDRLKTVEPTGAFYIMIDVRKIFNDSITDSFQLCKYLLSKKGIAFIPGDVFGIPGFIRMSIATSDDIIEKGLTKFISVMQEI